MFLTPYESFVLGFANLLFYPSIPHDINTMHELWGVNSYRRQNKYLSCGSIMDAVGKLPESDVKTECVILQEKLIKDYERLSTKYHTEKVNNKDNSLVLG